jgi:hypothetical protein
MFALGQCPGAHRIQSKSWVITKVDNYGYSCVVVNTFTGGNMLEAQINAFANELGLGALFGLIPVHTGPCRQCSWHNNNTREIALLPSPRHPPANC